MCPVRNGKKTFILGCQNSIGQGLRECIIWKRLAGLEKGLDKMGKYSGRKNYQVSDLTAVQITDQVNNRAMQGKHHPYSFGKTLRLLYGDHRMISCFVVVCRGNHKPTPVLISIEN